MVAFISSLILEKKTNCFDKSHYLHIQGTAKGILMAPSYANIFMGKLQADLLHRTPYKPSDWRRFIDDIFNIWPHGEQKLTCFLDEINSFHPTIKIKAEWFRDSVTFLDTTVMHNGDWLVTDLHTLHWQSCRPPHCKRGIAFSQALRLRRICARPDDYVRRIGKQIHIWSREVIMGKQYNTKSSKQASSPEKIYLERRGKIENR